MFWVTTMPFACPLSFFGFTTWAMKCSSMISALALMVCWLRSTWARSFFCAFSVSNSGFPSMDFWIS